MARAGSHLGELDVSLGESGRLYEMQGRVGLASVEESLPMKQASYRVMRFREKDRVEDRGEDESRLGE